MYICVLLSCYAVVVPLLLFCCPVVLLLCCCCPVVVSLTVAVVVRVWHAWAGQCVRSGTAHCAGGCRLSFWIWSLPCQISVLRLATHTYQDDQDLEEQQVSEWVMCA